MGTGAVWFSAEALAWLKAQAVDGETINHMVMRWAGMAKPQRVAPKERSDGRVKYPILNMVPGDEVVVPWNRDKFGNPGIKGLSSAIARCNRLPGRRYRATATPHGLHVVRIT